MTETEKLRQEIGSRLWEYWSLLPEPKRAYTEWYATIDEDIEDWPLSAREKRIAVKKRGRVLNNVTQKRK